MNATIPSDRNWSLTGTILFHATIIALLFLMKCGTGGGGGNGGLGYTGLMSMDVAGIGNDVDGWGDFEDAEAPVQEAVTETVTDETSAISDESQFEEAPVVSNKPKTETTVTKPVNTPKPNDKPKEQQVSGNLNNAFGSLSKGGNGNTSGGGQQGTSDGKIDGKGVLNGGGSLGSGGGQGGGNGTGNGPGNGPGSGVGNGGNSSWKLSGRGITRQPSLSDNAPDEGVVVVDIWVDKNGNVTKAVANPSKSTTTNRQLYTLAENAAKSAKFSTSTSSEQKGEITINFKLK